MTLHLSGVKGLSLSEAAQTYAAIYDFRVIPLVADGKAPLMSRSWKELATDDPHVLKDWWKEWPDANVGLVMGDRYDAIDLDMRDDRDGRKSWQAIGGQSGVHAEQNTPSGGGTS